MSNTSQTITIQGIVVVPGTNTVQLSYSNGTGDVVETDGQGTATITYVLSSDLFGAGWSIVGYEAEGSMPADMTVSVAPNNAGNALVIVDQASVSVAERFSFLIRVCLGSASYTSTDLVICNEPE